MGTADPPMPAGDRPKIRDQGIRVVAWRILLLSGFNRSEFGRCCRYCRRTTTGDQFCTVCMAISRVCVPGVPFSEKVSGTVSLGATLGTTTLN